MQDFNARRSLKLGLLTGAALSLAPLAAYAADLKPTPEGAQRLAAVFTTYLGKPAEGAAPPVAVSVEGDHYAAAVDLAALAGPLKASGFSMDAASITYSLTERDDGTWRVTRDGMPKISARVKDQTFVYDFEGAKFEGVFDPAFAGFKSAAAGVEKVAGQVRAPGFDEDVTVSSAHATQTGSAGANGSANVAVHEEASDLAVKLLMTPGGDKAAPDAKPVPVSLQSPKLLADIAIDGAPMRKALDLWAFIVAHPGRPDLAANEQGFKELLRGLAPDGLKLAEKIEMQQIAVQTQQGAFGLASGKFGFAASSSAGPTGAFEYHLAADGLALPPDLLPPPMQDLAPTAFNIDIKASGLDFGAGVAEAIADLHLEGDGPVISEEDRAKIFAKMKGSAPLVVALAPSHVVARQLDATLEGEAHFEGARPNGTLKVQIRNFDKTVAAIKALGPLASPQLVGTLAMAKALAKSDSDGALTWVAEYGADGSIKVNGLPLGKAP